MNYHQNLTEYKYKDFDHKNDKKIKIKEIVKIFIKLKNLERFLRKFHFKKIKDNNIKLYYKRLNYNRLGYRHFPNIYYYRKVFIILYTFL